MTTTNANATITAAAINAAFDARITAELAAGLTQKNVDFLRKCQAKLVAPSVVELLASCKLTTDFIAGDKQLAVYAVERLTKVATYTAAGISEPQKASDQYRYAADLFASLRLTVAKDKAASLSRADLRATGTKGENKETATGYADGALSETVAVAGRIMAAGTAAVQTRNTFAAFEALGMVTAVCEERGAFRFTAKPAAPFYKRMNRLVTDRIAAMQTA